MGEMFICHIGLDLYMLLGLTCLRRCLLGSSTSSGFSTVPFWALLLPEGLLSELEVLWSCCCN